MVLEVMSWGAVLLCACYLRDANTGMWTVIIGTLGLAMVLESETTSAFIYYKGLTELVLMTELSAAHQALFTERQRIVRRVSHEMRSPLFIMSSSLEVIDGLCETALSIPVSHPASASAVTLRMQEIKELVSYCNLARETAVANLDELLLLDKMQSGSLAIRPVAVPIVSFCRDVLNAAARNPFEKKLNYAFDDQIGAEATGKTTLICELDLFRFRQVMSNLISNSQKFTPAGGAITLRISRCADSTQASAPSSKLAFSHLSHVSSKSQSPQAKPLSSQSSSLDSSHDPHLSIVLHVRCGGADKNDDESDSKNDKPFLSVQMGNVPSQSGKVSGNYAELGKSSPTCFSGSSQGDPMKISSLLAAAFVSQFADGKREKKDAEVSLGAVLIEVSDTGLGIAAEDVGKVFVEGQQINPERTQGGGGVGMGCLSAGETGGGRVLAGYACGRSAGLV